MRKFHSISIAVCFYIGVILLLAATSPCPAQSTSVARENLVAQAQQAQQKAVEFFTQQVAKNGGYVYQVSADLRFREGEGDAGADAVWVQPPGTPSVGLALVEAYQRTGDPYLLDGALAAAQCLIQGQLHSGGWQNHIDFDAALRLKSAYRVDGPRKKKAKNWSSFDDDQTQAAIRFLVTLDRVLEFRNPEIHDCVQRALDAVVANQYPNGGWAQGFEKLDPNLKHPDVTASFPDEWPRKHPGEDYWIYYTLNDAAQVRIMDSLWLAFETYHDNRFREAAVRGADFLLKAQMPEPQPAWAQQYNFSMHPVWARRFEPASISGLESQGAIEALLAMTERTGDKRFLKPIPSAIAYLKKSVLPDGRLARFYELKTNRPLYFTTTYQLTYDDSDLPTHYGFKVANRLPALETRYDALANKSSDEILAEAERKKSKPNKAPNDALVQTVISQLDPRGAWVEEGTLKYVKTNDTVKEVIRSDTFADRLELINRFIAAHSKGTDKPSPKTIK